MNRLTEIKIILVVRSTRLADLKAKFATKSQAKLYINSLGADFGDYESEDDSYQRAIVKAEQTLGELGRVQIVQRSFLPNFVFGPEELVVALDQDQDGLVANTLKYLAGQLCSDISSGNEFSAQRVRKFAVIPHIFKKSQNRACQVAFEA